MTTQTEETTKPAKDNSTPSNGNGNHGLPTSGGALDELKEAALEDPFFSFLHRYGNMITVACLAIGLVFLYMQQSERAFQESMQESARVLREGRFSFTEYQKLLESKEVLKQKIAGTYVPKEGESIPTVAELNKELDLLESSIVATEKAVQGKFDVLSQSRGGYGPMGRAYQVVFAIRKGDVELAGQKLADLNWSAQAPDSAERMYFELAALSVARKYLDIEGKQVDGIALLKKLAREGTAAHVPAALAVSNIATSDLERKEARELLKAVLAAHPEQAEVLEPEIASLN